MTDRDAPPMNAAVRDTLARMLAHYGRGLLEEPARVEGLLRDLHPKDRRETNLLVAALRERVPHDLAAGGAAAPTLGFERAARRLEEHLGLAPAAARWAVEAWAAALDLPIPARPWPAAPPRSEPQPRPAAPREPLPPARPAVMPAAPPRPAAPAPSERPARPAPPSVEAFVAPTGDAPASAPRSTRASALRSLAVSLLLTAAGWGYLFLLDRKIVPDNPLNVLAAAFALFGPLAAIFAIYAVITGKEPES